MSRRHNWLNGRTIMMSSHGYTEFDDAPGPTLTELGFDQWGRDSSDPDYLPTDGFVDLDMTWPDWDNDVRLWQAIAAAL